MRQDHPLRKQYESDLERQIKYLNSLRRGKVMYFEADRHSMQGREVTDTVLASLERHIKLLEDILAGTFRDA